VNKPVIKIGFTDYFNPVDEFFTDILSEDFEVVRDDKDPNYLFFCDENFGQNNLNYDEKKVIKIFYTGENRRPQNYRAHFGITFDHIDGPQFYRLPLYVLENWVNKKKLGWDDLLDFKRTMKAKDKEGFCSFVVRNGGCPDRNQLFHLLSEYKQVDSGGPLFNNVGGPIDQEGFNSHVTKTDFIKKRKFHIAYENSSYPGYVTEKILHGFLGESIPIYWGSPCVEMDFNKYAYISRHNFVSTEEMIDYIKVVDQNDELYDYIMGQPILNPYNRFLDLTNFRFWFRENVYRP
jgi:hypothetical protein